MARRTQAERKSETRARLIDAAAELFARKGFHAVSAEAVADAADRTTGALYSHFGGKEGLLLALLEVWKQRTVERLTAEIHQLPDPAPHFAAMWEAITAPAEDRGEAWLLLEIELWQHGARDPVLGPLIARRYAEIRGQLGEGLADWAEATGTELPYDPDETGALVLGLLLGCALQHRFAPHAVPEELVVHALSSLLGLRAPAARGSDRKTHPKEARP
ncbi:TetR/AcrR family transcriptional regulator [Streptomyces indicus]|uniref:DNA-binding transcriptional regulator, AcrR family n=1 Tax=Streptomyces indicus TaxID=417292 RepID=A0A1G8YJH2_9ACTN|nr:TetR/AcrR family transcriptional regulator [Streptomyces indicus]SDK02901.1 DNA-binding transcriptional regulator, AcrR family [Streptomyces indicus]